MQHCDQKDTKYLDDEKHLMYPRNWFQSKYRGGNFLNFERLLIPNFVRKLFIFLFSIVFHIPQCIIIYAH